MLAADPASGFTISQVAAAAGVSAGTVYNCFRDKAHLLAAAHGVPGAQTAWLEPGSAEPRAEALARLATAAFNRFVLLGDAAAIGAEVAALVPRLAAYLAGDAAGARVFYLALAGAALTGAQDVETIVTNLLARMASEGRSACAHVPPS